MKIIIDCMGGDHAPNAATGGAVMAANAFDAELILLGDENKIRECLPQNSNFKIIHTTDNITNEDKALEAIKRKKDSSMVKGLSMLKDGEADAFVSAGNTGALIGATTLFAGRLTGVKRVALAPVLPTKKGCMMLIDAGANVNCKPEFLAQFGVMGAIYMNKVMKVSKPRVGLLNIGVEAGKGDDVLRTAHEMLADIANNGESFEFVGNVEARDYPDNVCDVLVADGFAGNVMLKSLEGVASMMGSMLKKAMYSNTISKIGGLLLKPAIKGMYDNLDYTKQGGAPVLGASGTVIKVHGSSNAEAFFNGVRQAIEFTKTGVNEEMVESLK